MLWLKLAKALLLVLLRFPEWRLSVRNPGFVDNELKKQVAFGETQILQAFLQDRLSSISCTNFKEIMLMCSSLAAVVVKFCDFISNAVFLAALVVRKLIL